MKRSSEQGPESPPSSSSTTTLQAEVLMSNVYKKARTVNSEVMKEIICLFSFERMRMEDNLPLNRS